MTLKSVDYEKEYVVIGWGNLCDDKMTLPEFMKAFALLLEYHRIYVVKTNAGDIELRSTQ